MNLGYIILGSRGCILICEDTPLIVVGFGPIVFSAKGFPRKQFAPALKADILNFNFVFVVFVLTFYFEIVF